jgi:hypothetical protein
VLPSLTALVAHYADREHSTLGIRLALPQHVRYAPWVSGAQIFSPPLSFAQVSFIYIYYPFFWFLIILLAKPCFTL